ncbi:MAG: thioredoxin family protein [Spirochaetales bacterium]|nr:thioredoxin family protein [Spirochaetales bacterium]
MRRIFPRTAVLVYFLSMLMPLLANPATRIAYELPGSVAIASGGEATVRVKVKIPPGNHIYVGHEEESSTVLLDFQMDPKEGFQIAEVKRPRGQRKGPDRILEKEGEIQFKVFELQGRGVGSSVNANLSVRVQMCSNEGICYEPYIHKEKLLFLIHAKRQDVRDRTSSRIPWILSHAEAKEKARTRKQNLFTLITAPWCGACRYMEQKAFSSTQVQERLSEKFVALRILDTNPDRSDFRYNGYPTLIIRDPAGRELYNKAGAMDAAAFLSLLAPFEKEAGTDGAAPGVGSAQKNEQLILAIYQKNKEQVRDSLAQGANPSTLHGSWSALMLAVYFDQPEIVQLLIAKGADLRYTMPGGWTALSLAEAYQRKEILGVLQNQGLPRSLPAGRPPAPGKL